MPMMYQEHINSGNRLQGYTSPQEDSRYAQPFFPNNRTHNSYSRVVVVPAANVRKIRSARDVKRQPEPYMQSQSSDMNMRSTGHRQPIEHPNDKPLVMRNGTYEQNAAVNSNHMVQEMGRLSMHSPPLENSAQNVPPYGHHVPPVHSNSVPSLLSKAMMKSNQRVSEWQQSHPAAEDPEESFVIEDYPHTMRSASESESYSAASSSLRNVYHDEYDDFSDDDTGLMRSMSGIQKPPEVDTSCSRQNSNGSQSSLESGLSFHTVYPSGDGYNHPRPMPNRQQERNGRRPPQVPQNPAPLEMHPPSMKTQATASTEPYLGRSQSQNALYGANRAPSEHGGSGIRDINRRADEASRQELVPKPPSVFITYAEEQHDKGFKKLVLQLVRTLLNNGLQVRLDMLEMTLMSMSVSSWLDDNIEKCDFVVICVSPSYKAEVEQQMTSSTPDPHSLHTRYIYQRLLTQYIQNCSLNYRFIPVLIGGATRRHLPSLCQDTHVYEWPKDFEAIIYRLFKKEKYIQPKVGPPPKCTVETYDSIDQRYMNG